MSSAGSFATARRGGVLQSEVNEARHKLGARATPAQIAKVLGRCEADVRAILDGSLTCETMAQAEARKAAEARAAEARQRAKQEADEALLASMWHDGVKLVDIGARFGCAEDRIRRWAKRLGLPNRRPGRKPIVWTDDLDAVVRREYIAAGRSANAVAKMIPGASHAAVIGRAWRLGYRRPTLDQQEAA